MGTFRSIDELIRTLEREKILLKEMFAKRHSLQFRYDYALEMTEYKEERIRFLIENGVIRDTGDCLEMEDVYQKFFEVCGREYNITAKAGPLGITGNVAQYGDYKVYVQIANKEYLCTSTKIHSSIEDYGPYNWDSSEQYEPTGYDFCCSYLSQKIGTKIKVIVRDTDGYEYSKKFKIKNRAPKIQIDTVDTSVSEGSGTTSEDSNIVVTVGKKKYKCK